MIGLLAAFAAAAVAPTFLWMVVGTLLTAGFFFDIGMTPMMAFEPTEIAAVGFTHLGEPLVTGAALIAAAIFVADLGIYAVSVLRRSLPQQEQGPAPPHPIWNWIVGLLWLVEFVVLVIATLRQGTTLLFLFDAYAVICVLVVASGFLIDRTGWRDHSGRVMRIIGVPVGLVLGLLAIGSTAFLQATDPKRTSCVRISGKADPVFLLVGGRNFTFFRQLDGLMVMADAKTTMPMIFDQPCVAAPPAAGRGTLRAGKAKVPCVAAAKAASASV